LRKEKQIYVRLRAVIARAVRISKVESRRCRSSTTLVMQTVNAPAMVTTAISKHH